MYPYLLRLLQLLEEALAVGLLQVLAPDELPVSRYRMAPVDSELLRPAAASARTSHSRRSRLVAPRHHMGLCK